MERTPGWRRRLGVLAALAAGIIVIACNEQLDGGAACPVLCPEQNIQVHDTTFEAVALDTTITGFPFVGTETFITLASRGDTLDARAIVRFDSLTQRFTQAGTDTPIVAIDSSLITLRFDSKFNKATAPVTFEAYDVDTTAADTVYSALVPLFRPDRKIGELTIDPSGITDSVKVPLSNAAILAKLVADSGQRRLRVGIRVTSTASVELRLLTTDLAAGPRLSYDPSPDTSIKSIPVQPFSLTPTSPPGLAGEHADFALVVKAYQPDGPGVLAVGGLPSRRAFLRFDVPSRIVDSSSIVRATLFLTQLPDHGIDGADSLTLYPQVVRAGTDIADIQKAASFLGTPGVEMDSIMVFPGDSATRAIDMVQVVRQWKVAGTAAPTQHAIVVRSSLEGSVPYTALFFSHEATTAAVRPRLRISYVDKIDFGVP